MLDSLPAFFCSLILGAWKPLAVFAAVILLRRAVIGFAKYIS